MAMTKAPKKEPASAWPPFSVRFSPDTRKALERASADDMRPASHLVNKIVVDWLKEKGYLK
jgi:hypothetical protein